MKLVLLPGMDGTGRLLGPLVRALDGRLETRVLSYPANVVLGYAELTELVGKQLPADGDYAILAESFAGPIGLALARRRLPGLRALVLVVTFAVPPRTPLLAATGLLPTEWILSQPVPCWLACKLMLGTDPPPDAQATFCEVIKIVTPNVIAARLRAGRELPDDRTPVDLPALYIQAMQDRILPDNVLDDLRPIVPRLRVERVPGPHLVLDTQPDRCADLITDFLGSLN